MKETYRESFPLPPALSPLLEKQGEGFLMKEGPRVLAFYGEMGSGKTTTIRALCKHWGIEDTVNSPTFSLINEYRIEATGEAVYHFDFYRVADSTEAERLGVTDFFYSGSLCLIEWPEKVSSLLPSDTVSIYIDEEADGSRSFHIK
ncbi:MAG: tRNA (adenosine(37)-N6)-threonylcarbamoyltransferase complex ATPase subunit type 1 TsaE [Tannerellaceae bacterium]|jgi:tRNA threonylcarbamoyladenosine biosynthesis protein TsaE|nr:tRNA (adenosine(37)-N6)-threonylcarbamoyltransferase complex ATPase subunit type 1 TsaE [Tannerellaceae bacterium]